MITDMQTSLFFSWKGEEDCCGAARETVSMGGSGRLEQTANRKKRIFNVRLWLTAELHWNHRHLTRSSSRWPASQSQVGGVFPLKRSHSAIRPVFWLLFVCGCAGQGNGKYCCPKIYFNHRCFSGPYLNKGRIAELPQFIGPGNCVLVLKEVSRSGEGAQSSCNSMVDYTGSPSNMYLSQQRSTKPTVLRRIQMHDKCSEIQASQRCFFYVFVYVGLDSTKVDLKFRSLQWFSCNVSSCYSDCATQLSNTGKILILKPKNYSFPYVWIDIVDLRCVKPHLHSLTKNIIVKL